jgi:hypothetical protein
MSAGFGYRGAGEPCQVIDSIRDAANTFQPLACFNSASRFAFHWCYTSIQGSGLLSGVESWDQLGNSML